MKKIDFCEVFGDINENHVRDAHAVAIKAKKPVWAKWGAIAACLCLMVMAAIPIVNHFNNSVTDIEPSVEYTLREATAVPDFGELFPMQILEGYALNGSVSVYDETVLSANFVNEALDDTMMIRIANKDWFAGQTQNMDLGVVQYTKKINGTISSTIYIDGGEYIIQYSFSNTDVADNELFYDMVNSAAHFSD